MAVATYTLLESADPEERLEDAALFKAMKDVFGDQLVGCMNGISVDPAPVLQYGRESRFQPSRTPTLKYWEDPAFLAYTGRSFKVLDWDAAEIEVKRLHSEGKGAFLKSTRCKHYAIKVPVGKSLSDEEFEGMAYSFIDGGPKLMVQEMVPMEFEHRFFVINRQVVTDSPNAVHLTPLDYPYRYSHRHPSSAIQSIRPISYGLAMLKVVEDIAANMATPDAVIDLALVGVKVVCVEFNPFIVGGVGLFASDVRAIAQAVYERDKDLLCAK